MLFFIYLLNFLSLNALYTKSNRSLYEVFNWDLECLKWKVNNKDIISYTLYLKDFFLEIIL